MEVFGVHGGKTDEADATKKERREWELQAPLFRLRINQVFRYLVDRPLLEKDPGCSNCSKPAYKSTFAKGVKTGTGRNEYNKNYLGYEGDWSAGPQKASPPYCGRTQAAIYADEKAMGGKKEEEFDKLESPPTA